MGIFDLKSVNPNAAVSVKLVSEQGVGVLALGFLGPEGPLAEMFGVKLERGNYKATYGIKNRDAYRTSNPKVFAAGDCRRGQSLVVWGIHEGREAASAIHTYLMG